MNPTGFNFELLGKILDTASLRHRVIAQNVANANTPSYRRMEVHAFDSHVASAMGGRPGEAPKPNPRVVVADGPEQVDGNTVDVDREMNDLIKNSLLYEAAAQIVQHRLASLRSAIAGR